MRPCRIANDPNIIRVQMRKEAQDPVALKTADRDDLPQFLEYRINDPPAVVIAKALLIAVPMRKKRILLKENKVVNCKDQGHGATDRCRIPRTVKQLHSVLGNEPRQVKLLK